MHCQHCGKKLPLLRKFAGGEFCSEECRDVFHKEAERLALGRLIDTPALPKAPVRKDIDKAKTDKEKPGRPVHPLSRPAGTPPFSQAPLSLKQMVRQQAGARMLASPKVELRDMGNELALGYFRGARPRARLFLPVSARTAAQQIHLLDSPHAHLTWDVFPDLRRLWAPPPHRAAVDAIDWNTWAEEIDEEIRRAEAGPPMAGLFALATEVDSFTPAAELASESVEAIAFAVATSLPHPSLALDGTFTQIAVPSPEPSRQLRVRMVDRRPESQPPLAHRLGVPAPAVRPGNRAGKLEQTELPTVLRRPTWNFARTFQERGMPGGGAIDILATRKTRGSTKVRLPQPSEPIAHLAPTAPRATGRLAGFALAGQVELPLPGVAGRHQRMASEPAEAAEPQRYLDPPNAVPLDVPIFSPPLSSLRRLAVIARNPVDSRRPRPEAGLSPVHYAFTLDQYPQTTIAPAGSVRFANLHAPELPGCRSASVPAADLDLVSNPVVPPAPPVRIHHLSPLKGFALGKVYSLPGQLNPCQQAPRPRSIVETFTPKGFVIFSSIRLRLRKDAGGGLVRRFGLKMPQLPNLAGVSKWGAGIAIAMVAAVVLFNGAPPAAGNITPSQPSAWDNLQQTISRRAAVALTDDFRTGLGEWTGTSGWGKSWSFDRLGFARAGSLALYSPSVGLKDYRFEFLGQIEKKALSWVVRAADLENYQVVRLELSNSGPVPRAYVVRYPVIAGKKGSVTRKDLPITVGPDTMYRVAMETRGADQVLMVQGQMVDTWSEPKLDRGGIGFFSGAGERARIRWVGVWHQYDMIGRLCAYLAPKQAGTVQ